MDVKYFNANFWYNVWLKLTIKNTLLKIGGINKTEAKNILADYKRIFTINKIKIIDIQLEYHVSWCSMILAIYKTYRNKNYGQKSAIEITEKIVFQNMGAESIEKYMARALDRAKDAFAYIVESSKKQEVDFFGKVFEFNRLIDNENKYQLDIKKCFYYEFFHENNSEELMEIACKWDLISWIQGIDKQKHKINMERNITIGNKEKDCEFIFERIII
ncbi:MAG: L-2-amino-thiazoline-4-carboxylic acid hydrolase [Treponema sp.]|jgi:hypothetical protein|nr:L-2-amino-thiazoline-4-carboxylic acid hydrolase [Treponema sp.]